MKNCQGAKEFICLVSDPNVALGRGGVRLKAGLSVRLADEEIDIDVASDGSHTVSPGHWPQVVHYTLENTPGGLSKVSTDRRLAQRFQQSTKSASEERGYPSKVTCPEETIAETPTIRKRSLHLSTHEDDDKTVRIQSPLDTARDSYLQRHQAQRLSHLRSVMSVRSTRSESNAFHTQWDKSAYVRSTDVPTTGVNQEQALDQPQRPGSLRAKVRSIRGSLRRMCSSRFGRNSIDKDFPAQQVEAKQPHYSKKGGMAEQSTNTLESVNSLSFQAADDDVPPSPPPHLELPTVPRESRAAFEVARNPFDTAENSRVTSWANSSGRYTLSTLAGGEVVAHRRASDNSRRSGSSDSSSLAVPETKPLLASLQRRGAIRRARSSSNGKRMYSALMKRFDNPKDEKVEPLPDNTTVHDTEDNTLLKDSHDQVSTTVRVVKDSKPPEQQEREDSSCHENAVKTETQVPSISPSIYYSRNGHISPTPSPTRKPFVRQHRDPSNPGYATISVDKSVSKWALPTLGPLTKSDERTPVTSNDWRSWADKTVAGLGGEADVGFLSMKHRISEREGVGCIPECSEESESDKSRRNAVGFRSRQTSHSSPHSTLSQDPADTETHIKHKDYSRPHVNRATTSTPPSKVTPSRYLGHRERDTSPEDTAPLSTRISPNPNAGLSSASSSILPRRRPLMYRNPEADRTLLEIQKGPYGQASRLGSKSSLSLRGNERSAVVGAGNENARPYMSMLRRVKNDGSPVGSDFRFMRSRNASPAFL